MERSYKLQQGNRRYQTSPAVCNPTPTSRPIIDSSDACNQASARVECRCIDKSDSQLLRLLGLSGALFPKKLPLPLRILSLPRNTLFLGPSPLITPNGISIGSDVFVWVPTVMLYNALPVGKKTPKLPLPLGISSLCRSRTDPGHRQHIQKSLSVL